MSLALLFYSFCIINISKYVLNEEIYNIDINSCKSNQIYDSITYKCDDCRSYKSGNNCYSRSPISLYTGQSLTIENCNQDQSITELDNKGNILGYLMCANTKFTKIEGKSPVPGSIPESPFKVYQYHDVSRPQRPESPTISQLYLQEDNKNEIREYYYNACIDGLYEKACQFFVNLCVLAMYESNHPICQMIEKLDKKKYNLNENL